MFRRLVMFAPLHAPDDGAGGGEVPAPVSLPPAEPVSPPPVAPPPDPAATGDAAMRARVLGTDDPEALLPDNAPYRQAKELRDEIVEARAKYGPIADLPPAVREMAVRWAPVYGHAAGSTETLADVQYVQGIMPTLDPGEQDIISGILDRFATDPREALGLIRQAAEILRNPEEADTTGGTTTETTPTTDPDEPITRAEAEALAAEMVKNQLAEADRQRQIAEETTRGQAEIRQIAKDLGYDPDATEDASPWERQRYRWLIGEVVSAADAGTAPLKELLDRANSKVQGFVQQTIDQYAAGKLADANRSQLTGPGATPSGERVLGTHEAMEAAMRERLSARGFPLRQP